MFVVSCGLWLSKIQFTQKQITLRSEASNLFCCLQERLGERGFQENSFGEGLSSRFSILPLRTVVGGRVEERFGVSAAMSTTMRRRWPLWTSLLVDTLPALATCICKWN